MLKSCSCEVTLWDHTHTVRYKVTLQVATVRYNVAIAIYKSILKRYGHIVRYKVAICKTEIKAAIVIYNIVLRDIVAL